MAAERPRSLGDPVAAEEFLATVGHELRTPLAAIRLWLAALRSGNLGPDETRRALDAIARSTDEQSRLIEALLDRSLLASGKLALVPAPLDLRALVENAVRTWRSSAATKAIPISLDVEDGVGQATLDGARVEQVLGNLLSNAVRFTPSGGKVSVAVRRREGHVAIEVADTGEGISPGFLPHVFDGLPRAGAGVTRRHSGLGIGLAIARQLVELHGGSLEARSDGVGRGATFLVRLPAGPLAMRRVLLVEGDAEARESMRRVLEHAGATVAAFGDGREALAALDAGPRADVIVSALDLAGMSGLELIERIVAPHRERGSPPPPSCALAARAGESDARRAIELGFDMVLAEPVTPERLVQAVVELGDILDTGGAR